MTGLERILVGYDGSDPARRALEVAASIARNGTDVTVTTVAEMFSFGMPDPFSAEEQKRLLAEARELLAAHGVSAGSIDPVGEPAEGVVWAAEKLGADLVIVGTHGRGAVGRLFVGSVATAVLHRAPCSVLVVP